MTGTNSYKLKISELEADNLRIRKNLKNVSKLYTNVADTANRLLNENARLREALEFYAAGKGHIGYDEQTKEFYEAYDNGYGITEQPLGYEAREALKGGQE